MRFCLCTNSYVRCAHRPAGLCTPTCSAHRPAQHTDPLCMQIFTAHQPACLLLSFRSKLPKFSFYVLRFAHPNVSKVLLKIWFRPAFVWPINIRFFFEKNEAHGSSDVCSELTQATHAQKGTQADKFTMASA